MKFKEFVKTKNTLTISLYELLPKIINVVRIPMKDQIKEISFQDYTFRLWVKPSPLVDWLEKHGITEFRLPPKYIDGGTSRCYFLNDKVVKITRNKIEANIAKILIENNYSPTSIIDVTHLTDRIYAILQHKINTNQIEKNIKMAADYVAVLIDDNPEMEIFPKSIKKQIELCEETLKKYKESNFSIIPNMLIIMEIIIKIYNITGFKHDDVVTGNIGLYKGDLVVSDLGPNPTKDIEEKEYLDKLKTRRKKLGLPDWGEI